MEKRTMSWLKSWYSKKKKSSRTIGSEEEPARILLETVGENASKDAVVAHLLERSLDDYNSWVKQLNIPETNLYIF